MGWAFTTIADYTWSDDPQKLNVENHISCCSTIYDFCAVLAFSLVIVVRGQLQHGPVCHDRQQGSNDIWGHCALLPTSLPNTCGETLTSLVVCRGTGQHPICWQGLHIIQTHCFASWENAVLWKEEHRKVWVVSQQCICTMHMHIQSMQESSPSYPVVYTNTGTYIAAAFSGSCAVCSNSYHVSYFDTPSGAQHFYPISEVSTTYFMTTSTQTAFEVEYQVYTAVHAHEDCARLSGYEDKFCRGNGEENWRLNVRRLEDAWFTYQLVFFFEHHNQLNDVSFGSGAPPSNRRGIESLCELAGLHFSKITSRT